MSLIAEYETDGKIVFAFSGRDKKSYHEMIAFNI